MEAFIHPSCQICLIVTGILTEFLIWAVQNFVYPSVIYGCTPRWREGCCAPGNNKCGYRGHFALVIAARFLCNVSRNKDALQVESVLTYTRKSNSRTNVFRIIWPLGKILQLLVASCTVVSKLKTERKTLHISW